MAALPEVMHALVFNEASRTLALQAERPVPAPREGEVLIRVRRAGICSTDLEICNGYVPGFDGVLGHEFVGEVVSAGSSGRDDLLGQRVVGELGGKHSAAAWALLQCSFTHASIGQVWH